MYMHSFLYKRNRTLNMTQIYTLARRGPLSACTFRKPLATPSAPMRPVGLEPPAQIAREAQTGLVGTGPSSLGRLTCLDLQGQQKDSGQKRKRNFRALTKQANGRCIIANHVCVYSRSSWSSPEKFSLIGDCGNWDAATSP